MRAAAPPVLPVARRRYVDGRYGCVWSHRRGSTHVPGSHSAHANTAATGGRAGAAGRSQSSPTAPAFLGPLAEPIATRDGDASPTSAEWIATTRQAAMSVDGGDTVDAGGTAVDFVVIQGSFIAKMAFGPNGDDVPTGSVLAFTVDPTSHTVLDLSLNDAVPDLSSLGAPQALVLTVNSR